MTGVGEAPSWIAISAIGWALLHFLWQGLALGAIAATAMTLVRSAAGRYTVGVATLVLMAAAPITTVALQQGRAPRAEASRAEATTSAMSVAVTVAMTVAGLDTESPTFAGSPSPTASQQVEPRPPAFLRWFVYLWLAGMALFSLRTAGGLLFLRRLRREHATVVEGKILEACEAVQKRMKIRRVVRYYRSTTLEAPAVIGWLRPIVLLPVSALTGLSQQQLRLIVAHELAHVQRLDPLVNALQIGVETSLFYHPAVWWISRQIRIEREHCCDDVAIEACDGRLEYAQALAALETLRRPPTLALAANGGSLGLRIARILGVQNQEPRHRGLRLATSAFFLMTALGAGVLLSGWAPHRVSLSALDESQALPFTTASFSTVPAKSTPETPSTQEPSKPSSTETGTSETGHSSEPRGESVSPATPDRGAQEPTLEAADPTKSPLTLVANRAKSQTSNSRADSQEFEESFDRLPRRHRDAFRVHGVTTDYIRAIRSLGLDPKPDDLIAFRVHGVSADYIRELQAMDLVPTVKELIAFRVHGVQVETLHEFDRAGLRLGSSDDVVALHVHGVTPEEVEARSAAGLSTAVDALLGMRIHGVTPSFVQQVQSLGLQPDSDQLIAFKIHSISPEFVSGLLSAGLVLDPEELVRARVHGVTPTFISAANTRGFQNLDLQEWIELKRLDVVRQ